MMQPLSNLNAEQKAGINCLFADIDDTITSEGRLTAEAYAAMQRWQAAGKKLIPITGRPAGWCDHIARMWPVDAVVGENGAFYFLYDREQKCLQQRFLFDHVTRENNRQKMLAVRAQILREVPGSAVATDQNYREADLAIDFCEDVPALGEAAIDQIVAIMQANGMQAKVSSIHVNGWFGDYDKLGMTKTLMREQFGLNLDKNKQTCIFIGDSPNDAPMFNFFPFSVGVRNLENFLGRVDHQPTYITLGHAGIGFTELVEALLA